MKRIMLILMLAPIVGLGQKSEIINDSLATKDQIYSKSMEWVAKTWKNADKVIDLQDKEAGTIVVKGGLATVPKSLGIPAEGMTSTNLTIRVKDGKAKLEFEGTNFKWATGALWVTDQKPKSGVKQWEKWKESVLIELDEMIANYKAHLTKDADF